MSRVRLEGAQTATKVSADKRGGSSTNIRGLDAFTHGALGMLEQLRPFYVPATVERGTYEPVVRFHS